MRDSNSDLNIYFCNLLNKAIRLLERKKNLVNRVWVEKTSQKVEVFIEKCNHRTCITSISKLVIISSSLSTSMF